MGFISLNEIIAKLISYFQQNFFLYSTDAIFESLVFPNTSVPAVETNYYCMTFELQNVDTDYHLIATRPIVKNQNVVHHMLLYGCKDTGMYRMPTSRYIKF